MVGFDFLSPALLDILNQAVQSQNLVKYLYYNTQTPLQGADITDVSSLLYNQVFPSPFDTTIEQEDCSQLRVFYQTGKIQNDMVVDNINVIFDIIVAKSLWLINDGNGNSQVRPYMIMSELEKQFRNQSVGRAGRLLFQSFDHIMVDKMFNGIRLTARMTTFSSGNS